MNDMTLEKLQYNTLKEQLKPFCVSGLGQQLVDKLQPSNHIQIVATRLQETREAQILLNQGSHIPFVGVSDVGQLLAKLDKGIILEASELLCIADFLRGCRVMKKFMESQVHSAPMLASYAQSLTPLLAIEEDITYAIKGSRIATEASKELKRIRRLMDDVHQRLKDRLTKFLANTTNKNMIQEALIIQKQDRYTIPIKAAYKNQVAGAIVETSTKGATVFIEPQSVTKLNVELVLLKSEEEAEEYQIKAALTGALFEQLHALRINVDTMAQYDFAFAKGKYSKAMDGILPKVNRTGYVRIINGQHPLLTGDVEPLQFEVGKEARSLMITGPNAGGKTVVLKTIGLLTLAVMSGLPIKATEGTEIAVFERIFVDIGDNQSMENALSTFSSHMKNIGQILQQANANTLLLFDEIGSGTEPNEGAALAIALLETLYAKGCITVATTHYGEIKAYAEQHPDFINAAMAFDAETLAPLYQLITGKSGESNALFIAEKMQIPTQVLQKAAHYMETKAYNFTQLDERKVKTTMDEYIKEVPSFTQGDRVYVTALQQTGIIYQEMNDQGEVVVLVNEVYHTVLAKRVTLEIEAKDLYPEGYDIASLFISYEARKEAYDLQRGSKKVWRRLKK